VTPHFDIPLNLPHAGTVAARISRLLGDEGEEGAPTVTAARLEELLRPYRLSGEDPPRSEAAGVAEEAAGLGRRLVDEIVEWEAGGDRLGQCIRNLFECLERGEEGAALSLRAGEDPRSLMRPG